MIKIVNFISNSLTKDNTEFNCLRYALFVAFDLPFPKM